MKIGIDLHETITSDPEMFKVLMAALMADGIEVIIISGPPKAQIKKELRVLKITQYDSIESVVDFLLDCGHEHRRDDKGDYHFDNKVWWQSKALICAALNIDLMIDDKEQYGEHFVGKCRFFLIKPARVTESKSPKGT